MLSEVLWGIAVGDAIGNPLEFFTPTKKDFQRSSNAPVLKVSDDTQMTLFLTQAMAHGAEASSPYLQWYLTQILPRKDHIDGTGLLQFKSLYSVESPGLTCMKSCDDLMAGRVVENDSKGNGTVMRCAPIALIAYKGGWLNSMAYERAKVDALLTHKHPYAWMSSVLLVAIYLNLLSGQTILEAVRASTVSLRASIHPSLLHMVTAALSPGTYEEFRTQMAGWVAEEALVLAVGAVAHSNTYMEVIEKAAVMDGDSDTVAGIAGGIAAACGMSPPEKYRDKINVKDAIEYTLRLVQHSQSN